VPRVVVLGSEQSARQAEEGKMAITSQQARIARKLLGWTQKKLAGKAGMSKGVVTRLETGKRRPTKGKLIAIRHALEGAGVELTEAGVTLRNEKAGP
jgi:transcriptional regulator with XRE-family HTH domain